ncbi:MAG: hypothetical protein J6P72_07220 [Firmicutes bacterium]|nr:hypothetical protein [Bacillota bacterium]
MAIMKFDIPSETMGREVTFEALVPSESLREGEKLKTLYLLHGVQGSYINWITCTNIYRLLGMRNANMPSEAADGDSGENGHQTPCRLAVIMPSGGNGFYHPIPADPFYGRQANMGHQHDYEAFIARELVEKTRKMLPLSERREDTGIAGLSMGGYGALYLGVKYADTFGFAGGLSSALLTQRSRDENFVEGAFFRQPDFLDFVFGGFDDNRIQNDVYTQILVTRHRAFEAGVPLEEALPELYFACGEQDPLLTLSASLDERLTKAKVPHTFETHPGAHEWAFWEWGIERILQRF